MSLFPSANFQQTTSDTSNANTSQKWLENKSFAAEDTTTLYQGQKSHFTFQTNSDDDAHSPVKHHELDDSFQSGSDSNDEDQPLLQDNSNNSGEKVMLIDTTKDNNNMYFQKPYKVHIPKFHRSFDGCIGLPPYLEIVFNKDRKKRKRKHREDRYFHLDKELLSDNNDENVLLSHKSQVEKLNIETRENPNCIDSWLQLVTLQDELFGRNVKLCTEKKVAILNKATSANPREIQLKLKRLELLTSISEDSDREWKNLVFQHPDNKTAWDAYINHTLSHTNFTVRRTLKVYEKCFETLSSIRNQAHRSKDFVKSLEKDMMSIFEKMVQFLVESGHTELTITLLLLMLEINVRSHSCNDLSDVKLFFESGDPILGESDSLGWDEWSRKHEQGGWTNVSAVEVDEVKEEEEDDDDIDFDISVEENWFRVESIRGTRYLLPWRSERECEDPGRKIVYDDLKGLLFLVKEVVNQLQIINIFLQVIGTKPENWNNFEFMLTQPCQLTQSLYSNEPVGQISPSPVVVCSETYPPLILPRSPHHNLVCLVLEQLTTSCPADISKQISAVSLGYFVVRMSILKKHEDFKSELKRTYKEARKIAKTLLKNDPVNFFLWVRLAKIEYVAGKISECKKIFFNALSMCSLQSDALLLCRSYVDIACESDTESVKLVLSALGDGQTFPTYLQDNKQVTGAIVLRATRCLERICEELGCLYQQVAVDDIREVSPLVNAVCCYVTYLNVTSSTSVHDIFKNYLGIIRREKNLGNPQAIIDMQHMHTFQLSLINNDYRHCNVYRNTVLSAVDDLPDSPQFALMLCQVEIGSSLTSIARRVFSSFSDQIKAFFAVYFEMLRLHRSANLKIYGVTPRVLHLLERSVSSRPHDVLLWRIYAKLSEQPSNILTRASTHCPWSKSIACDRVRLGGEKIDDVISFMQEKGLRVRTPVEEIRLLLTM